MMPMRKTSAIFALVAIVFLAFASRSNAQETRKRNVFGGSPLTWQVEPILDRYVAHVGRYYNLTPDQEEYTRQLLNQRVKRFLDSYEEDLRSLLAEYTAYQVNRELPSPEAAKDLARRAGPLVAAIKKEILDGNMQWREILDEEQRKLHDRDLELMDKQFETFEDRMQRWSEGKPEPQDLPGRRGATPEPGSVRKPEDVWAYRVRTFIRDYNLDPGQQETAHSILRELREEAQRYREKHQEEFDELETKFREISQSTPKTDPEDRMKAQEQIRQYKERLNELEKPNVEGLRKQLLNRLEKIPTEDQRRRRHEHHEKLHARSRSNNRTDSGTTRPAMTRPAETDSEDADTQPTEPSS
jgi:hypothetical protein